MTTAPTEVARGPRGPGAGRPDPPRTRFVDVLRMEWTKLRSVPSTFFALAVTLLVGIGLSALVSALAANEYRKNTPGVRETWDPTPISTAGGSLAQLAVAVLATLVITSEYSTGEICASLVAVPTRVRLLAAKAATVAVVVVVVGEVTVFISFFLGQALISAGDAPVASLGDPGVLRALLGTSLYLVLLVWLALGIGTLLRGTAATISTLVAMLYVLPGIVSALPSSWSDPIMKYWPTQAGGQITNVVRAEHTLGPWAGLGVMATFVAAVLVAAAVRLSRSDD